MRRIPNIITITRIMGSFFLLMTYPFSGLFFALYLFCGFSDILDGFLARRFQLSSSLGATLDSIADCIFVFIALYLILPEIFLPSWALLWIGWIFIIKGCTFVIGMLRYHGLAFLHTYLNKATGAALFCFPWLYSFWGIRATVGILCGIATIAALEELWINLSAKELQRDRKGLFIK